MKSKLLFAALLVVASANGTEEYQGIGPAPIYAEAEIHNPWEDRVNQLNDYYKNHMEEYFCALDDLECVFDEDIRKSFFRDLILNNNSITDNKAMSTFIRAAAQEIIKSAPYQNYAEYVSYGEGSPQYEEAMFLFSLVEALDPVTRYYMAQVESLEAGDSLVNQ